MKTNSLTSTIKAVSAAALFIGMLAAAPAYAFSGTSYGENWNKW